MIKYNYSVVDSFKPGENTTVIDGVHVCTGENCISSWWLVIQWFILSLGECLVRCASLIKVSPEGLKLTYMNAGNLLKSQCLGLWLMMSGLGSLFVLLVTSLTAKNTSFNELNTQRALQNPDHGISLPFKYFFFTFISLVANIWFILWAMFVFKYKDESCSMTYKRDRLDDTIELIDRARND
jgi:dipeptide/tripeptide permease